MSQPFIGQIRIIGFNFAPRGWAFCDGQILAINQNQSLYSILGTTYGGDGITSFALPDLRGRTPTNFGDEHQLGQTGGRETVNLTVSQIPAHTHALNCNSTVGDKRSPVSNFLAADAGQEHLNYSTAQNVSMANLSNAGGSQPHNNMQPYSVLNFVIALEGLFPSRN